MSALEGRSQDWGPTQKVVATDRCARLLGHSSERLYLYIVVQTAAENLLMEDWNVRRFQTSYWLAQSASGRLLISHKKAGLLSINHDDAIWHLICA